MRTPQEEMLREEFHNGTFLVGLAAHNAGMTPERRRYLRVEMMSAHFRQYRARLRELYLNRNGIGPGTQTNG